MKRTKKMKIAQQFMTIALYIPLFIAVIFLMRYAQDLLDTDVKINLTEIVTQNKDVITSKLNLEMSTLDFISNQITDRLKTEPAADFEHLQKVFIDYSKENEDLGFFIAGKDGKAVFQDGRTINISGRNYYKLAIEGTQNISDRIVSRLDGEDVFVISVPLKYHGEIIGTIQRFCSPQKMYELCSISLFSSKGYMYIINNEGYILFSSLHNTYSQEAENYFRMIYANGNHEASDQLRNDISNKRAGFMETILDKNRIFSAYTPIAAIHNWYLISSVDTDAVSPNATIVVKMFYFILSVVVLIFGISFYGFLWYKNKQQSILERVAFVDSVTHGNTFNKFTVDLLQILQEQQGKQFHLLKFDIDNFKYVNNFYGFDFGDRILYQIYQTIESKLLPSEIIARISSDHFVVLLESIEEVRLRDFLESIQNEEGVPIYFSAGLYKITDITENINLMLDKASTAAFAAKGSLNKRIELYTETFDQVMIRNEQLKRSVKQALADDEMIPFFQPKINIDTGQMVGAEALVRWRTKEGGLIPPNEFIPLCEKTGLITDLDMIIFEKVLRFLKRNLESGVTCVPISVNFSRLHLLNKDFFDKVLSKNREYGVPTHLIELELTESVIFDNAQMVPEFIARLHENGFLVSMDDFGSGYSSLNMLKDIPIDILKIDKEFLNQTTDSNRQRIIFSAIAQMANQLNIKIVVEGVEVIGHVELMKEVGCCIAQGYYFSKPVDESSFEKMYREGF